MTTSRRNAAAVSMVCLVGALAGCSRPDPNPAIRVTGDPDAAVPTTVETSTTTTSTTTTTLYYSAERDEPSATDGQTATEEESPTASGAGTPADG